MSKRRPQRVFNSSLTVRISTLLLGLIIISAVIAAGIAVAVITDRVQVTSVVIVVTEANITMAIERQIRLNETAEYYDPAQTLDDLDRSLNEKMQQNFSGSSIKSIITAFVDQPVLIIEKRSSFRDDPSQALKNRSWIVLYNATVYFNRSYTSSQMRLAMEDYQVQITVLTLNGAPSSAMGRISMKYCIFRDTSPTTLTAEAVKLLTSISLTRRRTTTTTSVTPVPCSSSIQSYLSIIFERRINSNERLAFFNRSTTLQDFTSNVKSQLQSSFPRQFMQLEIPLFSDSPSLTYDATNSQVQTAMITLMGIASFSQNTSSESIRTALTNYTQQISLFDSFNRSSTAQGLVSSDYSTITDASPRQTIGELLSELASLCRNSQKMVAKLFLAAVYRQNDPYATTTMTTVATATSMITTSMPIGNTEPIITITPTTITTEPNMTTSIITISPTTITAEPTTTTSIITSRTSTAIVNTQTLVATTIASNRCQSFFEVYISLSLVRMVSSNERAQFGDRLTTMQDLYSTLRSKFQSYFLQVFVGLKMFTTPDELRIIPASNQSIIVNLLAGVYWTDVQSKSRIIGSLENYNLSIRLLTWSGPSSSALAIFSPSYSIVQDASLLELKDTC